MPIPLPGFLFPPKSNNYAQTQRIRILHVMLLAALVGALYFALQNIVLGDIPSAISLFLLGGISLVALALNRSQHFQLAAFMFGAAVLGVLDYALFEGRAGLYDPGIVVYPIFILCTTFLFKRQGFVLAIFFSIASVALLYWLEINRIFKPFYPSSPNHVVGLSVLFVITALITWIVGETWESHLKHLQESYDLTLKGWAKALEYRDGETEGHSQRVTELCVALARKLGIRDEEILNIQRGALVHDIGKMAIPDRILFKPGPLDETEWAMMKQHPALARELISGIPFLQPAMAIPYSHHEYWDGSGYPNGLKGEEIPLAARIFTVIDQWDALRSDRPYRKAWTTESVTDYLRKNRGKIFDPRIVDAFLAVISEGTADA
jgi:HD-GYP domain-containing protein (c-di-GMP phosphodiesterase class II)